MINVNFIEQSLTADGMMKNDHEKVQTTQEEGERVQTTHEDYY